MFYLNKAVKSHCLLLITFISFSLLTFTFSINAFSQENKDTTRCYASKCYGINVDCPEICSVGFFTISFDDKGNSNLDTYFGARFIGKQRRYKRKYIAKIDRTNDNKTDLIFALTFSDCGNDSCGKVTGKLTYIKPTGSGILRECGLNGYIIVNCPKHQSFMSPQNVDNQTIISHGNIHGKITDKDTGLDISGATISTSIHITATSDTDGYYFSDHPEGDFLVQTFVNGYYPSAWITVTVPPGTTNFQLTKSSIP